MSDQKIIAKKRAFSLIELSIVLVIIGLLIAGITGGISLLRGSTLRAVMSESRAFATAVNSFSAQYDYLPGDYKTSIGASGVGGVNGDGDGVIEYVNNATTPAAEGMIAWQHLVNASMIDATFTPAATVPTGIIIPSSLVASKIPASKVKSSGWVFDTIGGTESFVILTGTLPTATTTTQAPLVVGVGTTAAGSNSITSKDALSIDTKADDGYPLSGTIRVPVVLGDTAPDATFCFDNDTPDTTKGTYYSASSGTVCSIGFQVSQ